MNFVVIHVIRSIQSIQEACKIGILCFGFCFFVACGSSTTPPGQPIVFENDTVSFVNSTCSVKMTALNTSNQIVTLTFLQAIFTDDQSHTFEVDLNTDALITDFNSVVVPGDTEATASIDFDLSGSSLVAPLTGSILIIGVSTNQTYQFTGEFKCN